MNPAAASVWQKGYKAFLIWNLGALETWLGQLPAMLIDPGLEEYC